MAFSINEAEARYEKKLQGEWFIGSRTKVDLMIMPRYHPDVKSKVYSIERAIRQKYGLIGRRAEDPLPLKGTEELVDRIYSEAVVRDWKGVALEDESGVQKLTPYSDELCKRLLQVSPEFRQDVADLLEASSDLENEEREVVEGN